MSAKKEAGKPFLGFVVLFVVLPLFVAVCAFAAHAGWATYPP